VVVQGGSLLQQTLAENIHFELVSSENSLTMAELQREQWARVMQRRRSLVSEDAPSTICLTNCRVLNTLPGSYREDLCDVCVSVGGTITSVDKVDDSRRIKTSQVIDCSGHVLMPGKL
jgi:adenine deaminase